MAPGAAQRPKTWSSTRSLNAVASIAPSGRRSGALEITSGPWSGSSVIRPCEPFTSDVSLSEITSSSVRKPSLRFKSRQPIASGGTRIAGSTNSSTGS